VLQGLLPLLCKCLLHLVQVNATHEHARTKKLTNTSALHAEFNRAGGEAEDEIMAANDLGNTQKQWSCSAH
jgi:hypothetical protein